MQSGDDTNPTPVGVGILAAAFFAYGAVACYAVFGPWRLVDSLDWGSVGEWVSGLGALTAAGIALHIGLMPQRIESRTRKRRA